MKFTNEAKALWNKLSEEDQKAWTTNVSCQKCGTKINTDDFSGSVYEEQLALFHRCTECENKEVRLIAVDDTTQQEIDDDFDRWLKSKKEQHPEKF